MDRRLFIKRVAIGATLAPLAATAGVEMCKKKSFQITCSSDWIPTDDWTSIIIPGVKITPGGVVDFEVPISEIIIGGAELTLVDKDGKPNKKYVK